MFVFRYITYNKYINILFLFVQQNEVNFTDLNSNKYNNNILIQYFNLFNDGSIKYDNSKISLKSNLNIISYQTLELHRKNNKEIMYDRTKYKKDDEIVNLINLFI